MEYAEVEEILEELIQIKGFESFISDDDLEV